MISFTANQQTIVSSDYVTAQWLFDVTDAAGMNTYRLSTISTSYGGNDYAFGIDPGSFNGVTLRRGAIEEGIISSDQLNFRILDPDHAISASSLKDGSVLLQLVLSDGTLTEVIRSFKFWIKGAVRRYGYIEVSCTDLLQKILDGEYPNTRLPSEIFPDDNQKDDNLCVPEPYGTAFVPLRAVWCTPTAQPEGRYYLLGPSSKTYTVTKVRTPSETGNPIDWDSASYTFSQYDTPDGYKVLKAVIMDADGDGTPDSQGIWIGNGVLLDPRVEFSRSDTASVTDPAEIIKQVLVNMGLDTSDIEVTQASTTFTSWGLSWSGAFWTRRSRREVIRQLLLECGANLITEDKLYLSPHSAAPVMTVDASKIVSAVASGSAPSPTDVGSYSASPVFSDSETDSVTVSYSDASKGHAHDALVKVSVPAWSTSDSPGDNLEFLWVHNQIQAAKLAKFYAQRKTGKAASHSMTLTHNCLALQPGDVVTLSGADYGGTTKVLVEQIGIAPAKDGLVLDVTGYSFDQDLQDWSEMTYTETTISDTTTTDAWQPVYAGPDSGGTTSPNQLAGRLRVGDSTNAIILDPVYPTVTGPLLALIESGAVRAEIGKLDSDDYGVILRDGSGNAVMQVDSSIAKLAGWDLDATTLSGANIVLDSAAQLVKVLEGAVTRVEMGKLGTGNFGIRGYSASGALLFYIDSTGAQIGGFTLGQYSLSSGTDIVLDAQNKRITINSSTFGAKGVQLDFNGGTPRFYVGDGGDHYLKFDGSEPEFGQGRIKEAVYEIYTAGVIKTSADPAANGGVLIDPTGIYGYDATGTQKFKLDASTGTITAVDAQISGTVIVGPGSDVPWDQITGTGKPEPGATNDAAWRHPSDTTKIDGGKIYTHTITADQLSTGELITTAAQIGSAVIETAHIKTAQIDTLRVANEAITTTAASNVSSSFVLSGGRYDNYCYVTITVPYDGDVRITMAVTASDEGDNAYGDIWLMRTYPSEVTLVIYPFDFRYPPFKALAAATVFENLTAGTYTYKLYYQSLSGYTRFGPRSLAVTLMMR